MAKLSTHALDIYHGKPAAGLTLELWLFHDAGKAELLKESTTNADGRTDEPLLLGDQLRTGEYELRFFVERYFAGFPEMKSYVPFLRMVPIRFIANAGESYHVPLLFSPWAYSTYRGS